MIEILNNLGRDKFIYTSPEARLITLYDDFFYSRNDYDHLCPGQRDYIRKKFLGNDFKQVSGSVFRFEDQEIAVLKSPGLGISPLSNLLMTLEKYDYVVATPLSCFLYFISQDSSDEEILRLLKKCPVNLDQAFDFTYQEDYRPRLLKSIASYKSFQAEHEASHKFKKL